MNKSILSLGAGFLVATVALDCNSEASAAAAIYIPFDPAATGPAIPAGGYQGPWTGISGAGYFGGSGNAVDVPGGLSYGPLLTSGDAQGWSGDKNMEVFPSVAISGTTANDGTISTTGNIWFSYLVQLTNTGGDAGIQFNNGLSFGLWGGYGFHDGDGTKVSPNISGSAGATYFVVGDINYSTGNNSVSMWVNPDMSSLGTGDAPTILTDGGSFAQITGLSDSQVTVANDGTQFIRFTYRANGTGSAANFDELRVGGNWADVSPAAVAPEPVASSLLAVGALALGFRRRRA